MNSLKEKIDAAIALEVNCPKAKKYQKALQTIQSIKKGQEGKYCKSFCIYNTTGLMTNWQYSCIKFWQCKDCGCYSFPVEQILDLIKQIESKKMNQEIEKIKIAIPNLDEQKLRAMFMIALEALENIGTDAHDKNKMIFAPVVVENALDRMTNA